MSDILNRAGEIKAKEWNDRIDAAARYFIYLDKEVERIGKRITKLENERKKLEEHQHAVLAIDVQDEEKYRELIPANGGEFATIMINNVYKGVPHYD